MGIAEFWMNRIKAANPILAAVAYRIAEQSESEPLFDTDAAISAKLAEWNIPADSPTGRGFSFAVIYYQEEIAAKRDFLLLKLTARVKALQRLEA